MNEYMVDWKYEESHIDELAKEYIRKCDDFDEIVCTGKSVFGEPIPMSSYQSHAINLHAYKVLMDIKSRLPHDKHSDLYKAIKRLNMVKS